MIIFLYLVVSAEPKFRTLCVGDGSYEQYRLLRSGKPPWAHHFAERHDLAKPLAPPKAHNVTKYDIEQTPQ